MNNQEHARDLFLQALDDQSAGRFVDAEAKLRSALAIVPGRTSVQVNLAAVLVAQKAFAEASTLSENVLAMEPEQAMAWLNLGHCRMASHAYAEAQHCFERALALLHGNADVHDALAQSLTKQGRVEAALHHIDAALALCPDDPALHSHRGSILRRMNRTEEAMQCFERALTVDAGLAEIFIHRGNAWMDRFDFKAALSDFERAIALAPGENEAHSGRGNALASLGRFEEAVMSYHEALRLDPSSAKSRWNLSLVQLAQGNLKEGWRNFEYRWADPEIVTPHGLNSPEWHGETSLQGKTILLHAEQGLGDTLQFSRYVPMVKDLGAKVILRVQPGLVELMRSLQGADLIIADNASIPFHDCRCALMSLPFAFGTDLTNLPADIPYLHSLKSHRQYWREYFGAETRPKVGLVWSGNPRQPNDKLRSIPLLQLLPLLELDIRFIALQKEIRPEDQDFLEAHPEIELCAVDFERAAALIEELDLVISVCTSFAHLTGALGKSLWLPLCHIPDWRWTANRTDSPWYPGARLFRQKISGDWNDVVMDMKNALQNELQIKAQPAS